MYVSQDVPIDYRLHYSNLAGSPMCNVHINIPSCGTTSNAFLNPQVQSLVYLRIDVKRDAQVSQCIQLHVCFT